MKSSAGVFLWLYLVVSVASSNAETFYGPSSTANKFLIASNESVIISSIISAASLLTGDVLASNSFYAVHLYPSGTGRYAIAGPAELRIPSSCALYFKRVHNISIRTILLAGNDTTNGVLVSIPVGKTVEFFDSLNGDVSPNAFLAKTGFGSNQVQVLGGQRLDGPADIRLYNTVSGNVASFSCWFVEDVFQNPNALFPSASQTPQTFVEKSGDMNLWQPVAIFGQSLGSNTFYRLRISR